MKKASSIPSSIQLGLFLLAAVIFIGVSYLYSPDEPSTTNSSIIPEFKKTKQVEERIFGFKKSNYNMVEGEIQRNQFLSDILLKHKVPYRTIDKLAKNVKSIYDVRNIRSGKPYYILSKDSCKTADYFIYEPNDFKYIVYSLKGDPCAEVVERNVQVQRKQIEGTINSSLWLSMDNIGVPYSLISKMEDAFAWSVDFYHMRKGDKFKLWYEEQYIDGEAVGTGKLLAGKMTHIGKDVYAIYFEGAEHPGFYDLEGRSMKKAFLKSPVEYGRISSSFNRNRYHPILKKRRPHLGTDYAAAHGTPIRAVAAGTVIRASYTNGNGNYVKIKHDETYTTQYLHMRNFADGIAPGTYVEQGETIGYVGSTGLATGPHVCFRFWKNNRQVNHLKEDLPPPEPMDSASLEKFMVHRDTILRNLGVSLDSTPLTSSVINIDDFQLRM